MDADISACRWPPAAGEGLPLLAGTAADERRSMIMRSLSQEGRDVHLSWAPRHIRDVIAHQPAGARIPQWIPSILLRDGDATESVWSCSTIVCSHLLKLTSVSKRAHDSVLRKCPTASGNGSALVQFGANHHCSVSKIAMSVAET
jgi:hypothetical protein